MPYTILGDEKWKDYEVSGRCVSGKRRLAGVMGRVNHTGTGYGCVPKGYYLRLAADGKLRLVRRHAGEKIRARANSSRQVRSPTSPVSNGTT